jgi:MoaA/NifB/PqqE/SkfB family radical SAM enzyme
VSYAFATPYPGTGLYENAKSLGLIKNNWEYIQKLCDTGDTRNMAFNLTAFTDHELIQMRAYAIRKVKKSIGQRLNEKRTLPLAHSKVRVKATSLLRSLSVVKGRAASALIRLGKQPKPEKSPFVCVHAGHFVANLDKKETLALFKKSIRMVEIEVFSFCNRRCWFCPNSHVDRNSKNIRMKENVYHKILQNLEEIDYNGVISFSRYNEPLADQIIFECIRQAKKIVPRALLHLNTNGDYLKEDTLYELYDVGLRSLNIQIYLPENIPYTDELATKCMLHRLQKNKLPYKFQFSRAMDWLEYNHIFRDMKIRVYARNFRFNGTHRGGIIRELHKKNIRKSPCLIPFHDVYIDFNGKVVPCCNIRSDIPEHAELVLGDINYKGTTLFNIFSSRKAAYWRRSLIGYWEKVLPCDRCSFQEIAPTPENLRQSTAILKRTNPGQ